MRILADIAYAALLGFAGSALVSQPSTAMEQTAACHTLTEVANEMASEGQLLVVAANQKSSGYGQYFYLNPKDDTGYVFMSDAPLGKAFTCARVLVKLDQAGLFDARTAVVDPDVLLYMDGKSVTNECKQRSDTRCGFYNDEVKRNASAGLHVYFRGIANTALAQHMEARYAMLTVVGAAEGMQPGKMLKTSMDAATKDAFEYSLVSYTKTGVKLLDDRRIGGKSEPSR